MYIFSQGSLIMESQYQTKTLAILLFCEIFIISAFYISSEIYVLGKFMLVSA